MSADPKLRDLRHNLCLVLAEMWRWPRATAIGLALLAVVTAAQLHFEYRLGPLAIAIGILGQLAGILGLKVFALLMLNPVIRKRPFQGSYLVASFITMVPVFVFYAYSSQ